MPDPSPESFDDTSPAPSEPPARPDPQPAASEAPDGPSMSRGKALEVVLSATLRLGMDTGPALGGLVVAVARLIGVVPQPWPGVIPAAELWPRWREAVAVLARDLPGATHAERTRQRAAWAAIYAADAAWEAR